MNAGLSIIPVEGIGEVSASEHVPTLLVEHAPVISGDVLVVTSKIIAKAEGRVVPVDDEAVARADLIESESVRVLRRRGPLMITETTHGFICANAGVDFSNVPNGHAVLLPVDPDRSARKIRDALRAHLNVEVGVIISDTFGRPWRRGVVDVAIGTAGIRPVLDLRGQPDGDGRTLQTTEICIADEIASAAELVMRKDARIPAVIVRGISSDWLGDGSIRVDVIRSTGEDLFR